MRFNPYLGQDRSANYVSQFVPLDLNLIQQNVQQAQQRYDQTMGAWLSTQAKAIDETAYDPTEKQNALNRLQEKFNNVYKKYNGDLGAGQSDVLGMIATSRNDPYYALNEYALEQKKRRQALEQQYGSKALRFKDMKEGLVDKETGKFRNQSDFDFEIMSDLDRQAKADSIVDAALQKASVEGGLYPTQGGKFLTSKTVAGNNLGNQLERKLPDIYKEYMSTAEGKLHARILKEELGGPKYQKDEEVEREIKSWLKGIGYNRVSPESVSLQHMVNPDYEEALKRARSGKNGGNNNGYDPQLSKSNASTGINPDNHFKTTDDILKKAREERGTYPGEKAYTIMTTVGSKPEYVKLREQMRETMRKYGVEGNFYHNGTIETPSYNSKLAGSDQKERKKQQETYTKEFDVLRDSYNNLLKQDLGKHLTSDPKDMKWHAFEPATEYDKVLTATGDPQYADDVRKLTERKEAAFHDAFKGISILDVDILGNDRGPLNGLSDKGKLKIIESYRKAKPGDASFEDLKRDNLFFDDLKKVELTKVGSEIHYRVTSKDGRQMVVRPNNATLAMKLARATADGNVKRTTASEFLRFTDNKVFKKEQGGWGTAEALPDGFSVKEVNTDPAGNTVYQLSRKVDDSNPRQPITVEQFTNYLAQTKGQEDALSYMNYIKQMYGDDPRALKQPAIISGEYTLGTTFNLIND